MAKLTQLVDKRHEDVAGIKNAIVNLQHYFSLLTQRLLGRQREFDLLAEKTRCLSEEACSPEETVDNSVSCQRYVLSIVRTLFFIDSEFKREFVEALRRALSLSSLEEFGDLFDIVRKHKDGLGRFAVLSNAQFAELFGFDNPVVRLKQRSASRSKRSIMTFWQRTLTQSRGGEEGLDQSGEQSARRSGRRAA